jgi:hypothetical protein
MKSNNKSPNETLLKRTTAIKVPELKPHRRKRAPVPLWLRALPRALPWVFVWLTAHATFDAVLQVHSSAPPKSYVGEK